METKKQKGMETKQEQGGSKSAADEDNKEDSSIQLTLGDEEVLHENEVCFLPQISRISKKGLISTS